MAEHIQQKEQDIARRSEERLREPRAKAAHFDRTSKRVVVELTNGCTFMFPSELAQGLRGCDPELIAEVEVEAFGLALHWERLDADLTIDGLLAGMFGTKRWMAEMGRAGGSVKSDAKAESSRANGAKGGRPRKQKTA